MKALIAVTILFLIGFQPDAIAQGVTLDDAVNQAKSEGRVLSAKTIGDRHEIKILTPSGTVKTINKNARKAQSSPKNNRPEYYNRGGQSMRDRKQNPAIPSRFNNQQKNNRRGNRQLDLQPMTFQNRNKSQQTKNQAKQSKKNKDK